MLELVEHLVDARGEVVPVDPVDAEQHRLLRQLFRLVRLEFLDAELLAVLRRRFESLEQKATHDGVADEDGGEANVREKAGDDRLDAFVASSSSTFHQRRVVVATTLHDAVRRTTELTHSFQQLRTTYRLDQLVG